MIFDIYPILYTNKIYIKASDYIKIHEPIIFFDILLCRISLLCEIVHEG